jgi:predicted alpha/beta hydrolase
MSLPPARWAKANDAFQVALDRPRKPAVDLLMSMVWGVRNEGAREPFKASTTGSDLSAVWYQTEDGWTAPLWRLPPRAGATGEPVIIAPGLGLGPRSIDLNTDRSLVRFLHAEGYDVFVFSHRGVESARPPSLGAVIDFDAIVEHDLPAAIALVKQLSGAKKVHWVGHGLGGQCLIGHLASDGGSDIAAGVLMSTPVRFQPLKATARRIAAVAKHLPEGWRVPTRLIHEVLTVASHPADLAHLSSRIEGPMARSMLLEATTDLSVGLIKQMAGWHTSGQLTDRENRFDYLEGIRGRDTPIMVMASATDILCDLDAARPVVDLMADGAAQWVELPRGWGHLDLIAGADADRVVFPNILAWLNQRRDCCWEAR